MTQPGWYPDQSGGPNMKYWDGQRWHDAIPAAPTSTAPTSGGTPPGPNPHPYVPSASSPPNGLTAADFPASAMGKSKSVLLVVGSLIAIIVLGGLVASMWPKPTGRVSPPAASVPAGGLPASVPTVDVPISRDAPVGESLEVHMDQFQMDGTRSKAIAAVKVDHLQAMPDGSLPASGTYYAVSVGVYAAEGSVTVNPFFFSARTANGINLRPTAAGVGNLLPATELPQGQKVVGGLGFDVPPGEHIAEIILSDPLGKQLGRWLVK